MEEDDNSGDLQLQVETPHTQRLSSSEFSIKLQLKLEALGVEERAKFMKAQVEMFQQKVKLCEESYSSPLAETIFSEIRLTDGSYVDSIYKLKQYLSAITPAHQNAPATLYAKWYINNLAYLKELKTNFDERIYLPLTKFYNRSDPFDGDMSTNGTDSKENTNLSELRAPSSASVLKFKNDLPEVADLYDFAEVDNIASRLKYLRQRWQLLLEDESEISATLFSCDSQKSSSADCPRQLVNLLRLVPDLLVKCQNGGLLASQWLQCSNSKAIDLKTKYSKLERVKSVLTERLSGLSEEIKSEEKELAAESTDLEMLADREERANEMMSTNQQMENKIQRLQSEIEAIAVRKNTPKANDELEILRLNQQIELLVYEKGLLEEDLSIELEVKPCMIRFTDQIQEKCESLEQNIDTKRQEKQRVQSALVPVIADRNRTQAEISKEGSIKGDGAQS